MTGRRPGVEDDQQTYNGRKLDAIKDDVSDMRVAMTSLAGDVKAMVHRIERHDGDHAQSDAERSITYADVERRIRALERRAYAIPGLSAVLGVAGLLVAMWAAFGRQ